MRYGLACVIACKDEQGNVSALAKRIDDVWCGRVLLVFVDDGSRDGTWDEMVSLAKSRGDVECVRMAPRGFGQESAIRCGLKYALAHDVELVCVMDGDGQDPPELLCEMASKIEGDVDQVVATRHGRGSESAVKRVGSAVYYSLMSKATGFLPADIRNFRVMRREVAEATLMREPNAPSFKYESLLSWGAADTVSYDYEERLFGRSKYDFFRLARYACEGFVRTSKRLEMIPAVMCVMVFVLSVVLVVVGAVAQTPWLCCLGAVGVALTPTNAGIAICALYVRAAYVESCDQGLYVVRDEVFVDGQD